MANPAWHFLIHRGKNECEYDCAAIGPSSSSQRGGTFGHETNVSGIAFDANRGPAQNDGGKVFEPAITAARSPSGSNT